MLRRNQKIKATIFVCCMCARLRLVTGTPDGQRFALACFVSCHLVFLVLWCPEQAPPLAVQGLAFLVSQLRGLLVVPTNTHR